MFVQTQTTPNPNSLKFLPGKTVSNSGSYEITEKNTVNNDKVHFIKHSYKSTFKRLNI